MIKLTEIISKPVISISSGVIFGTVDNAVFNKKFCLTHLSVFDEKSNAALIPASRILHAENNAVIVKNIIISSSAAQVN
ncbi:MAG: hypothetical protein PHE12_01140, partial [Clostridia bacterium]|nr:hypothetical protein [Clostridia bacterium]